MSHAVPSGDLALVLERAVDAGLERETRRRMGVSRRNGVERNGTGKPRKRRAQKQGSRHIPVEVERAVRERDGERCAFVDGRGRRCSETRFLTIEHDVPYAFGGPPTVENCRQLCAGHNAYTARLVFGQEHIESRIAQARQGKEIAPPQTANNGRVYDQVLSALVGMGFKRERARRALGAIAPEVEPQPEALLRAALGALTSALG